MRVVDRCYAHLDSAVLSREIERPAFRGPPGRSLVQFRRHRNDVGEVIRRFLRGFIALEGFVRREMAPVITGVDVGCIARLCADVERLSVKGRIALGGLIRDRTVDLIGNAARTARLAVPVDAEACVADLRRIVGVEIRAGPRLRSAFFS